MCVIPNKSLKYYLIHLLFAITYLSLISIIHLKLCVVDYPPPPPRNSRSEFESSTSDFM